MARGKRGQAGVPLVEECSQLRTQVAELRDAGVEVVEAGGARIPFFS